MWLHTVYSVGNWFCSIKFYWQTCRNLHYTMWINAIYTVLGYYIAVIKQIKTIWCYDYKNVTLLSTILQCARIVQINPSSLHLQEIIVRKFHHLHPHQNHNNKNRDRNRMYVSIFLYYYQNCLMLWLPMYMYLQVYAIIAFSGCLSTLWFVDHEILGAQQVRKKSVFPVAVSVLYPFRSHSFTLSVPDLYLFTFTVPVRFALSSTEIFVWHLGTPRAWPWLFMGFSLVVLTFDFAYYIFRI